MIRYIILIAICVYCARTRYSPADKFYEAYYSHSNKTANRFNASNYVDVWLELEDKATEYNARDFGLGFPSYFPPKHLVDAIETVSHSTHFQTHQYARTKGHPRLVRALAALYSKLMNRDIDPLNEILVTTGAMHALRAVFTAYLNPGDEIILFEPFYHVYRIMIGLCGGVPVYVPLRYANNSRPNTTAELTFDPIELESKISSKTKLILLNNPNNPTGKMFTLEEQQTIANISKKHNIIVVADEVAQFYELSDRKYVRYPSTADVWPLTITVNSGGKTFANTGWRIGWIICAPQLLWAMEVDIFASVIAVSTPMQEAFAIGLEIELQRYGTNQSYFNIVKQRARHQLDMFLTIFRSAGIRAVIPEGGYFLDADFTDIRHQFDLASVNETRFGFDITMWFVQKKGLFMVPGVIFYSEDNRHLGENLTRLCFIKSDEDIEYLTEVLSGITRMNNSP